MDAIVTAVSTFLIEFGTVATSMKGIFAGLVALGLIGLLFSRIGK